MRDRSHGPHDPKEDSKTKQKEGVIVLVNGKGKVGTVIFYL